LLFAIAGIAALLLERLRAATVRPRAALFISLLERPG
jgi:hypothetical protein